MKLHLIAVGHKMPGWINAGYDDYQENRELEILKGYLPVEMGDEELDEIVRAVISETGAQEIKEMGRVIGEVMKRTG